MRAGDRVLRSSLNHNTVFADIADDTISDLVSLPANDFYSARNSLCQRPPGPESIMTVELDTSGLALGDTAGLALLSSPYAWIGVVNTAEGTALQVFTGGGGRRRGADPAMPRGSRLRRCKQPPPPFVQAATYRRVAFADR